MWYREGEKEVREAQDMSVSSKGLGLCVGYGEGAKQSALGGQGGSFQRLGSQRQVGSQREGS